jgi:hypothetical protein
VKAGAAVYERILIWLRGRGLAAVGHGAGPHNNRVHPPAGAPSCEHGCSLRSLRARRG